LEGLVDRPVRVFVAWRREVVRSSKKEDIESNIGILTRFYQLVQAGQSESDFVDELVG